AVERARAFWKNQHAVPSLQDTNHSLNGAAIDAFLIDGDHVQLWQKPAQQRHIEKCSPCQKINRSITRRPGQWRIEIALVIHRENYGPALNHALPMNHSKTKEQPPSQPGQMVTSPIVEIHSPNAICDLKIANRQADLLKPRADFLHDLL